MNAGPVLNNPSVYVVPCTDQLSTVDKVHAVAWQIDQTAKRVVQTKGFGTFTVISLVEAILRNCGSILGTPLVVTSLLISPFLFLYDAFRIVIISCRKITQLEGSVQKLLPLTKKHLENVDKLKKENAVSSNEVAALKFESEELYTVKADTDEQLDELQQEKDQLQQEKRELVQQVAQQKKENAKANYRAADTSDIRKVNRKLAHQLFQLEGEMIAAAVRAKRDEKNLSELQKMVDQL